MSISLCLSGKVSAPDGTITRNESIGFEKPLLVSPAKSLALLENDSSITQSLRTEAQNHASYYRKFSEILLKQNRNSLQRKRKKGIVLHLKDLIYYRTEVYV